MASTGRTQLAAAVAAFLANRPRTQVLRQLDQGAHNTTFWHARVSTKLWGFADDFQIQGDSFGGQIVATIIDLAVYN